MLELFLEVVWSKSRSDPETCECKDCIVITIRNEGPALQKSMNIRSTFHQNWECVSECCFLWFVGGFWLHFVSILRSKVDPKSMSKLPRFWDAFRVGSGEGGWGEGGSGPGPAQTLRFLLCFSVPVCFVETKRHLGIKSFRGGPFIYTYV